MKKIDKMMVNVYFFWIVIIEKLILKGLMKIPCLERADLLKLVATWKWYQTSLFLRLKFKYPNTGCPVDMWTHRKLIFEPQNQGVYKIKSTYIQKLQGVDYLNQLKYLQKG